jgi:catechol 2,3-dioxygenase-like lactoylglutathione lyase family enzyme
VTTDFLRSRTTLGVRSVPVSIDFYARALGFETVVTMGEPPNFALLAHGLVGLGLAEVASPAVTEIACCYIDVDGVAALHERCVAAGAHIANPLTRHPWGNYDFVVADPDGHLLAFGEVPTE